MEIRKTIWDSKSEKALFQSLHTQWSSKVNLYPHLPLCNIIKIDPEEVTQKEHDYYFKTEVDYTLCEQPNDNPILSIEFDGIGGGFSRNGEYLQKRETPDPNRKLKLDFKLWCASRAKYPFIVLSYDETEIFDKEDSLTILDGIVGQFLAKREMKSLLQERVDNEQQSLSELPEYEQREIVQDWVFAAEIDAELMHDPIAKRASILECKCIEMGCREPKEEYLTVPQLPDLRQGNGLLGLDLDSLAERAKAWKKVIREGCRVIVNTPKIAVVRTVWVRNFQGVEVSPFWIAKNIAHYLAFKEAYKILSR